MGLKLSMWITCTVRICKNNKRECPQDSWKWFWHSSIFGRPYLNFLIFLPRERVMQFNHIVLVTKLFLPPFYMQVCFKVLLVSLVRYVFMHHTVATEKLVSLHMSSQCSYPWADCKAFRDNNYVFKSSSSFRNVHLYKVIVRKENSLGISWVCYHL